MMSRFACAAALVLLGLLGAACSEETGGTTTGGPPVSEDEGTPLTVEVPATGRVFVRLDPPEVVAVDATSTGWDLAFEGWDVFTNSGVSGPGKAGAFPLDPAEFSATQAPAVPFLIEDATGGAFVDWYVYDPSAHVIWSRYHVFGVEDAGRLWKVQIYTFYGEVQGAPVSGLYQLRYAEVQDGSVGPTVAVTDLDATAGGSEAPESSPSACLDLETGATLMLTPAEARADESWHLCFRRAGVTVNGELGGPGAVRAVDVHATESASETLDEVKTRTAESETPRFEAVDHAMLTGPALSYRGDHVVSAFSDLWLERGAEPPRPADAAWLVQGADGGSLYLLKFEGFEGATDAGPGRISMRVRKMF